MKRGCVVTRIPVIQLRFVTYNDDGKEIYGNNRKFQKPGVAAEHWANHVFNQWRNELVNRIGFSEFQHRGLDDWEYRQNRIEKLIRRSLPIFKSMLK